jgi:hypothetical protein
MSLQDEAERIESRQDLIAFIARLQEDLAADPAAWPNSELPTYLEALAAWGADMDGYLHNRGERADTMSPWRQIGMMLLAAKNYE